MREIEIKARLKDRDAVMANLAKLGCEFEAPIIQEDVVYAKHVGSLEAFNSNDVFLRIRVRSDRKIIFTLKQRKSANRLSATEHEVEIRSKEEMEKILSLMGFKEAVRINKKRVITHHDGCEICLDEVEGLGSFIEMEKLTEDGDAEAIQEDLFTFFQSLGIKKEDRVMVGYDILMLQKP